MRRPVLLALLAALACAVLPAAGAQADPVIAAAGDIACDPYDPSYNGGAGTATACRQKATSDLVLDERAFPRLDAVLVLGDAQYQDGAYSRFMTSYDPTWGRLKAKTRPVPGNHEYQTPGAAGYYQYFGAAAGDPAKGYYSYDLGDWHVVALNSNCAAVGGCAAGDPQVQWLERDLAATSAPCVLAAWHHPRWSSGAHGSSAATDALWRALRQAGADVVLTGHDHLYERFAPQDGAGAADPNGTRQFVVGTGGAELYPFGTPRPNSEVRLGQVFGALKLVLHPRGYSWEFLTPGGGGAPAVQDAGTTSCSEPGRSTVVRDGFRRSVSSGLGTADVGGPWSVNAPSRTRVTAAGALLGGWTGGNQDVQGWTAPVTEDVEALGLVRLHAADPAGAGYQARVVVRAQGDARNGYAARIVHGPSGAVSWGLSRMVNAGGTGSLALGSGTLAASGGAGTGWWIRVRATGGTVQARFWREGTDEPSTWRTTVTDTFWTRGTAAIGSLTGAGITAPFPTTAFRHFEAMDLGGTAATAPGAPSLTAAEPGDGAVTLTWSPPASDGGAPVTGYRISRRTAGGEPALLEQVGDVRSHRDATAVNGTTYAYRVSAVNAAGVGPASEERTATPRAAGTLVLDDFERTVSGGFGTADVGGAWRVSATSRTRVAGGEAIVDGWTGGNQDVQAWTAPVRADVDVRGLVRLEATDPAGASYQARVVARGQADARNGYTARIAHTPAGAVTWAVHRVVAAGGTGTVALGSGTLASTGGAGSAWWVRLRVQGTTVQARFWREGTAEPGTWRMTATDAQWASGTVGVGAFAGAGLTAPFPSAGFRRFEAVDLGA